ncbi:MAG: universal stress protein [Sandaracinaceae bacterium]|nr:universal stress protein [Sandaracinaceae bacterium]
MIYFAHDGSLHADWVGRYAIRLARHADPSRLIVLHVEEPDLDREAVAVKLSALERDAQAAGVAIEVHRARGGGYAVRGLLRQVPFGARLVCGTRARPRHLAWLAGSVAARLLDAGHAHVLAIRVAQPGLLGVPRDLLLPVTERPRALAAGGFLPLLGHDLAHVHVLHVHELSSLRFRSLPAEEAELLLGRARGVIGRVEQDLASVLPEAVRIDGSAVISDDTPKEILIAVGRLRTRLIFLGGSERSLPKRVVYGDPVEQILRASPCDVAVYRGPR